MRFVNEILHSKFSIELIEKSIGIQVHLSNSNNNDFGINIYFAMKIKVVWQDLYRHQVSKLFMRNCRSTICIVTEVNI